MNTADLDVPCGYCGGRGRRDIPGGLWLSGPECLDCGAIGYLVLSPDAERLLAFIERHLGSSIRREIARVRAGFEDGSIARIDPGEEARAATLSCRR